jgi:hypothetical protein
VIADVAQSSVYALDILLTLPPRSMPYDPTILEAAQRLTLGAPEAAKGNGKSASLPAAKTEQGEGKDKKTELRQPRKRRRKANPKAAAKQEARKTRQDMEKAIATEWKTGQWTDYQDYVTWKNQNLMEGWPTLDRHQVTRAIENVNRRARYRKK